MFTCYTPNELLWRHQATQQKNVAGNSHFHVCYIPILHRNDRKCKCKCNNETNYKLKLFWKNTESHTWRWKKNQHDRWKKKPFVIYMELTNAVSIAKWKNKRQTYREKKTPLQNELANNVSLVWFSFFSTWQLSQFLYKIQLNMKNLNFWVENIAFCMRMCTNAFEMNRFFLIIEKKNMFEIETD